MLPGVWFLLVRGLSSPCVRVSFFWILRPPHTVQRRGSMLLSLICVCYAVSVVVSSACHHNDSSRPLLPSLNTSQPPVTWPSKQQYEVHICHKMHNSLFCLIPCAQRSAFATVRRENSHSYTKTAADFTLLIPPEMVALEVFS